MNATPQTIEQIAAEQQRYMVKVYGWMGLGLIITGVVAMFTASSTDLLSYIFDSRWMFFALIVLELVSVGILVGMINRISAKMATVIFIIYAIVNGLTMACIFIVYTEASIASAFFVTAGTFVVMSIYGYTTKTDLSKMGNIMIMLLAGIVIASLANYFLQNETVYWVTTYIGVLIFVGLTAHDTQKIKNLNIIGNEGSDDDHKEAIMGALTLYLDFINLFLFLLRIFGRRK